jgi:hypothetical protein
LIKFRMANNPQRSDLRLNCASNAELSQMMIDVFVH